MRIQISFALLAAVVGIPLHADGGHPVGFRGLDVGITVDQFRDGARSNGWTTNGDTYFVVDDRLGSLEAEMRNYVSEEAPDDTTDRVIVRGGRVLAKSWRDLTPWLKNAEALLSSTYGQSMTVRSVDQITDETVQVAPIKQPNLLYIYTLSSWTVDGVTVRLQVVREESEVWGQINFERS